MADVYVLASPTPTLFVYPSALHPPAPVPPLFGVGGRNRPQSPLAAPPDRRKADEIALAVLGVL